VLAMDVALGVHEVQARGVVKLQLGERTVCRHFRRTEYLADTASSSPPVLHAHDFVVQPILIGLSQGAGPQLRAWPTRSGSYYAPVGSRQFRTRTMRLWAPTWPVATVSSWHSTCEILGSESAAGDHNPPPAVGDPSSSSRLTAGFTDAGGTSPPECTSTTTTRSRLNVCQGGALADQGHARHLMEQPMLGRCGSGTGSRASTCRIAAVSKSPVTGTRLPGVETSNAPR